MSTINLIQLKSFQLATKIILKAYFKKLYNFEFLISWLIGWPEMMKVVGKSQKNLQPWLSSKNTKNETW